MKRFIALLSLTLALMWAFADYSISVDSSEVPYMQIGAPSGLYDGEYFHITNTGDGDTLTITPRNINSGPANITYCDDQGHCYPNAIDFYLAPGGQIAFHANVIAQGTGMTQYGFVISSPNQPQDVTLTYTFLTNDLDVLLVRSEPAFHYFYTDALDWSGLSYGVWERDMMPLTEEACEAYNTIIWAAANTQPALTGEDVTFLMSYLDDANGKNLFITGQRIGAEMSQIYSPFYSQYLHAGFVSSNDQFTLTGSHLMNDLTLNITGGDGAGNQTMPGIITAADDSALPILKYTGTEDVAALRVLHNWMSHIVYFDFGFEGLASQTERNSVMYRVLHGEFALETATEDQTLPKPQVRLSNSPNPFNPTTTIAFDIPTAGNVRMDVFNLRGQKVTTLVNEFRVAGQHTVTWNGADSKGNSVASGLYFCRLSTADTTITHKMTLLK